MEENSSRTLAYTLAKPIDIDMLDQISGGGSNAGMEWTSRETVQPSGSNLQNLDITIDGSIDW